MGLLARQVVLAHLKDEIARALRWASHHHLEHTWNEDSLTFMVRLEGHANDAGDREAYLLTGIFDDYRVLPPTWRFLDPRTGEDTGNTGFPHPGSFPGGSVLHSNGVVCAAWNRLAFKTAENPTGVHEDWGDLAGWEKVGSTYTQARTIPDMLARLRAEVALSPHRLAPLQPLDPPADEGAA